MNHKVPAALLTAMIAFGTPALAAAQEQVSPPGVNGVAVTELDRETQVLLTLRQQIPQDTIALVPIDGLDHAQRRMLLQGLEPGRAAALQHALAEATVATEDRPNGISEDQVTLAEYLIGLGIDPAHVVGVTIGTNLDRANPPVTLYYRGSPATS